MFAKNLPGAKAPKRLVVSSWMSAYHALPRLGGILDQPYREMFLNDQIQAIYSAVVNWRSHGGMGLNRGDAATIAWLVKHGLMSRKVNKD